MGALTGTKTCGLCADIGPIDFPAAAAAAGCNCNTTKMATTTAPPPPRPNQVFLGTFIHATRLDRLEYLHNAAVFVQGATGRIVAIEKDCDPTRAVNEVVPRLPGWDESEPDIVDMTAWSAPAQGRVRFFFPGFVDTHIHASQYPNAGVFGKSTLLDWLNTYTFPLEASLGHDLARARRVYGRCVRKTLSHGTTAAAYFATVDVAATNLLVDLCHGLGQRALVGRVCMDAPPGLCPAWYRDESAAQSVARTEQVMAHIRRVDPAGALVRPVVTPRFAPSCTAAAMRGLAALAGGKDGGDRVHVQTHISENPGECALVAELFPAESAGGRGYAGVYDAFGLLTDKTILAHGVHLSAAEADLIKERGSKVSHCPCSNSALTSGAARVRWLLDRGVDVGLGTDVSGGWSPSVLAAARQASLVSRHVAMGIEEEEARERAKLGVEEVLYLATRGGAKVVGLAGTVGGFEVGMDFDAQLVGLGGVDEEGRRAVVQDGGEEEEGDEDGDVDVFGWESWEDLVAKWLFNGDDRNTKRVWVRGRLVHQGGAQNVA